MRKWVPRAAFSSLVSTLAVGLSCGGGASDSGFSDSGGGGGGGGGPDSTAGDDIAFSGSDGGGSFGILDTGAHLGTGNCKLGNYTGTFTCGFLLADAGQDAMALIQVMGTLNFTLSRGQGQGEFTSTANGTFMANTTSLIAASATLGGTLDCNTGKFSGQLTNGTYSGWIFINGTFAGPLTSDYNGTTFSFVNGVWEMVIPGQGTCPGTWTANYVDQ